MAAEGVLQTAIDDEEARALAAEAVLAASVSTEEAARISGDSTLQGNIDALSGAVAADFGALETDFQAAVSAEEAARIAADNTLTADLATEVARAQSEEARIEAKHDAHFDGFIKFAYLTEADAAMGSATHYIVNASSAKTFAFPAIADEHFFMVKVAEGSNAVTFTGSINGESDNEIVMHPGTSVMVVSYGGELYLF